MATNNKKIKNGAGSKTMNFIAIVAVFATTLANIGYTGSYYSDIESLQSNSFAASFLDLEVTNSNFNSMIGSEVLGEKNHASVIFPVSGSLGMNYATRATTTSDTAELCGKLVVEAKLNGLTKYTGPLSDFAYATSSEFGSWEFRFDLPPDTPAAHGDKCDVETIFTSWRSETNGPEESGYFDEEKISFSFTARMVVLNEMMPDPIDPEREFIEIYNNGNTPVNLASWKISEISGDNEKFYTIGSTTGSYATPVGGSTFIPAYGFLTLNLSSSIALNKTGDTVKLYDSNITLLDSHSYGSVATGKSLVRMPDGIGYWVDPEPTPGMPNAVTIDDLRIAGFDDAIILEIMEMALLRSSLICENAIASDATTSAPDFTVSEISTTTIENASTINITDTATTTSEVLETATTTEGAATTTPDIITDVSANVVTEVPEVGMEEELPIEPELELVETIESLIIEAPVIEEPPEELSPEAETVVEIVEIEEPKVEEVQVETQPTEQTL